MGNQRFKLSYMIPNTWFYKLKDLTKPPKTPPLTTTTIPAATKLKKTRLPPPPPPSSPPSTTTSPPPPPPHCRPRKSYHFTRDLPLPPPEDPPLSPPRKSKSKSKSRKPTKKTPSGAGAGDKQHRFSLSHSVSGGYPKTHWENSPETDARFPPNVENAPPKTSGNFDIIIDIDDCKFKPPSSESYSIKGFDFHLPRIITKPNQLIKEEKPAGPVQSRRFSVSSPAMGVKLKINSPKIMGIKQGQNGNFGHRKSMKNKKSLSQSLAVVKSSDDPQTDFRESMVEMIVQNNLRASKDLEDLLACYLLLNSDEYHDVIIKVFKQIWFDLSGVKNQKLVS